MAKKRRKVPPPPASLVKLLHEDPPVRHYFERLQESLEEDTEVLRRKLVKLKKEKDDLQAKLQQQKRRTSRASTRTPPRNSVGVNNERPAKNLPHHEIDDAMLDLEMQSGSSSEEEEPSRTEEHLAQQKERLAIVQAILEAKYIFEQLGIAIVQPTFDTENYHYEIRKVDDIACDIILAIRQSVRVAEREGFEEFAPFVSKECRPCCVSEGHPASQVVTMLSRGLLILWKVCHAHISTSEWENLLRIKAEEMQGSAADEMEKDRNILLAYRGLAKFSEDWIKSLHGEIISVWPYSSINIKVDQNLGISDTLKISDLQLDGHVKEYGRIFSLSEQAAFVHVLVQIYSNQYQDSIILVLAMNYVSSCFEYSHGKTAFTFSFVILEAMLNSNRDSHNESYLRIANMTNPVSRNQTEAVFAISFESCKRYWMCILLSGNANQRNQSIVELKAYERLAKCIPFVAALGNKEEASSTVNILAVSEDASSFRKSLGVLTLLCSPNVFHPPYLFTLSSLSIDGKIFAIETFICLLEKYCCNVSNSPLPSKKDTEILLDSYSATKSCLIEQLNLSAISPHARGIILMCHIRMADLEGLWKQCENFRGKSESYESDSEFLRVIENVFCTPTALFINLKRRRDRLVGFLSRCIRSKLLANLGVEFGGLSSNGHAIDGREYPDEDGLARLVGSTKRLHSFVQKEWQPNLLRPFDQNAPRSETFVSMSVSEQACALSHIFTWRTAKTIFSDIKGPNYHDRLKGLSQLAGFATGAPLLPGNEGIPPSPVCLILEDDAILVDRFREKMESLLLQLPRDFHFCSIGYSRPRTAPIFPYMGNVGIPSCTYYMTGYLISDLGAEYLLNELPVRGPIDSWIGLKMTENWANVYGENAGVGRSSNVLAETPSRAVLRQIMQFRAFCAVKTLCSQHVEVQDASNEMSRKNAQNWRNRDTDIVYSGGDPRSVK